MKTALIDVCPICSYDKADVFLEPTHATRKRFLSLSQKKYGGLMNGWENQLSLKIRRCFRCDHLWHAMQPDQDSLWLMYIAGRKLNPLKRPMVPTRYMRRQMRWLRRLMGSGSEGVSMLDYGSGSGLWSCAAADAGFDVLAYEPCMERVELCHTDRISDVVHQVQDIPNRTFDVVNLEQVLEHVHNPIATLVSLRPFCHARTLLRICVPNLAHFMNDKETWDEYPFNGTTMHIMSPFEHLHGFSPKSLALTLNRAGFVTFNHIKVLLTNPVYVLRHVLGQWVPQVSQTIVIACFDEEAEAFGISTGIY